MASTPTDAPSLRGERRVQTQVALTLLETLKRQDQPGEFLDDEDVSLTIPRRFGLSGVVDTQIRRYRELRRGRIPESEIRNLLRLVIRRPDSEELFFRAGALLTAAAGAPRWRRILPRPVALILAGRRVRRRLRVLFGGSVLEKEGRGSRMTAVHGVFLEADPGGEACGLVTGLWQAMLETYGVDLEARHVRCQGRGDERCVWEVAGTGEDAEPENGASGRPLSQEEGGTVKKGGTVKTGEMVKEGDAAPDFRARTDEGETVALRDLRGRKVVLYFYPKDDTPGCTTEACEFRDALPTLEEKGAVVLGVSPDSVESHRKFKEKHGLNFPLLADEDREMARAYGVWKEKSMYGRKYWGVERTTFLIDEEGTVAKIWKRVRPKGHADAVAGEL